MSRMTRFWLIVFIAMVLMGLAFPLVNAFFVVSFYIPDLLVGSLWLVAGMSLLSLGCSAIIDRGKLRVPMFFGLALTWLAAFSWLTLIWARLGDEQIVSW